MAEPYLVVILLVFLLLFISFLSHLVFMHQSPMLSRSLRHLLATIAVPLVALTTAAAVPLGTSSSGAATASLTPSSISLGANMYDAWGGIINNVAPDMAQLANNGVLEVRQNFRWDQIQPAPGVWTWNYFDRIMTQASIRHIEVLPTLEYSPGWANGGLSAARPPTNLADFATFAAAVVARYGSGGSFWAANPQLVPAPMTTIEIWNEPWYLGYWANPDPSVYAQMVRLTSTAVRAVDPTIKVAICADDYLQHTPAGWTTVWVGALVKAFPDMAQYADVASVHVYAPNFVDPTSYYAPMVATSSAALASIGVNLPIWITETGSSATKISAQLFGTPPNTISPLSWAAQQNDVLTSLDAVNGIASAYNVTRVYEFSYFRSVSDTTWSALDGTDSGFYLLGPTGVVRGGGTGLFQWSGSHQLATGTTTQQAAASVRTGATRSKATHFDGRPGLPSGPPHHGGNRPWSDHWTPPAQDPPVPSSW